MNGGSMHSPGMCSHPVCGEPNRYCSRIGAPHLRQVMSGSLVIDHHDPGGSPMAVDGEHTVQAPVVVDDTGWPLGEPPQAHHAVTELDAFRDHARPRDS